MEILKTGSAYVNKMFTAHSYKTLTSYPLKTKENEKLNSYIRRRIAIVPKMHYLFAIYWKYGTFLQSRTLSNYVPYMSLRLLPDLSTTWFMLLPDLSTRLQLKISKERAP